MIKIYTHTNRRILFHHWKVQNIYTHANFTKEPLNIGLFCGKWPIKIRDPMSLRHPVYLSSLSMMYMYKDHIFLTWCLKISYLWCICRNIILLMYMYKYDVSRISLYFNSSNINTGWRRLIGSPKLQLIFHKRATKYRALLRKMTYKDKGSYGSSPPCIHMFMYKICTFFIWVNIYYLYICVIHKHMNGRVNSSNINIHMCMCTNIFFGIFGPWMGVSLAAIITYICL